MRTRPFYAARGTRRPADAARRLTAHAKAEQGEARCVTVPRMRLLAFSILLTLAAGGASGCGSDGGSSEARIARERADAARVAVQGERIKNLDRELKQKEKTATPSDSKTVTVGGTTTVTTKPKTQTTSTSTSSSDWPGGSHYTVVLASLGSQSQARVAQRRFSDRGLDAGVLNSSDYSSLRSGYWVVFSGVFPDQSEANTRASRAKSLGVSDAYPRFVAP